MLATEYSKSTGDYASLSLVDIKLIALSIDLFEEFNKKDIEFKTPKIQSVVGAGQPKPVDATNAESNDQKTNELETLEKDVINEEGEQVKQGQGETTELSAAVTKLKASEVQEAESDEGNESGSEDESEEEDDDDEDDDEGWITPSNYKQKFKIEEEVTLSPVGILSTDFAIQVLSLAMLSAILILLRLFFMFTQFTAVLLIFLSECGASYKYSINLTKWSTNHNFTNLHSSLLHMLSYDKPI